MPKERGQLGKKYEYTWWKNKAQTRDSLETKFPKFTLNVSLFVAATRESPFYQRTLASIMFSSFDR